MLFCVKTPINKLYVFAMALLLAVTLAGCSGSNDTKVEMTDPPVVMPDPDPEPVGPTQEEIDVMTAEALTKAMAINAEASATPGTNSGAFDDTDDDDRYTVSIKHTGVEVTDPRMNGDDDPKFVMNGMGMNVRGPNDDGETEIVVVHTDIEAPKATEFAKVAGQVLNVSTNMDNDLPQATNEALLVLTADSSKIMSAGFSATGAAVLTFDFDHEDTENTDEAAEVVGTYNSAPGTYRCNGNDDCTVTLNAKGEVTAVTDEWIFTPDEGAMSPVPDGDFLHYGFWLKKTTDEDGVTTYNAVQTFAGSSIEEFPGNDMMNVVGSATYEGGAAGVYARKVFDVTGVVDPEKSLGSATAGAFTADIELTAKFGGADVATNDQFSIAGSISNFVLSGEEENSWAVNLKASGFGNGTTNKFTGTANGGGDEAVWNGTFHGVGGDTEADDDGPAKNQPTVVVGEFNAHFSNGHVSGAYGARKQ